MYRREVDYYWSFRTADTKEYTHCYHVYPAMMIPQVARKLLEEYAPQGRLEVILDPYMGSGTTLVEASLKGIRSVGSDINPLARFISRVKTTLFDISEIEEAREGIMANLCTYSEADILDVDFTRISNHTFWYTEDSLYRLSYINQCIEQLPEELKDFYRVCLSETVREVSFTRNGEFKRYKMSAKQLESFAPDVFLIFAKKVSRNIEGLIAFGQELPRGATSVYDFNSAVCIPTDILPQGSVDMVITSPPYGDSHTTVAYGQFSRWSNEWFGFEHARNLDNLLMGGKITREVQFESRSIEADLRMIREQDEKRYFEVVSFLNDYWASIKNVAQTIRHGGRVCYVVGNRRVKGVQINLDFFTAEMFEKCGFRHDVTIVREIPNKRMPAKTSPTNIRGAKVATMSNEYIVILTKEELYPN